ncbi:MAG: hypothetical protein NTV86_05170 [Planctomycetota bacterium]|nr:hypothetical protein [Planctomycetota bacterium]
MDDLKHSILGIVAAKAAQDARNLSAELMAGQSDEAEAIQAGLEFERWLASSCRQCLREPLP